MIKHALFLHVPKTGGTAVEAMIRRHDGPINPGQHADFIRESQWLDVCRYKYFFTHTSLAVAELLPRPLFTFTILRDPVDRVISAYNHILRAPEQETHKVVVAKQLDLIAALADPLLAIQLNNVATRMLGTEVDLRAAWPNAQAMHLAHQWAWEAPADESTCGRALARLRELDFVGFTERLDTDGFRLAALLGLPAEAFPRENETPQRDAWPLSKAARSREIEQAVRQHNRFDCLLYEEARKLFWNTDEVTARELTRHALAHKAAKMAPVSEHVEDAAPRLSAVNATEDEREEKKMAHNYKLLAESMLPRIRQLEDERDQKFEWAQNYRQLVESLQQQVHALEAERDQKFEWAQNYRQLAESLQQQIQALETDRDQKFEWAVSYRQSVEALQQLVESLQADRDEKFAWAENYKASMENEKQRADEFAQMLVGLQTPKPGRYVGAANRILHRLKMRGTGARPSEQAFPARINVGCGFDKRSGYLNIDVDLSCLPDLLIRDGDYSAIPLDHFEEVYAKDVLEHIPRSETLSALLQWASWLKANGSLWLQTSSIVGVADRLREMPKYADHHASTICLFGNQVHQGDFHHTGFTEVTLRVHLLAAGLEAGEPEIIDGWMYRVIAKKVRGWDEFLLESANIGTDAFIEKVYVNAVGRAPDSKSMSNLRDQLTSRKMTRRQVAMLVFASPERLFYVAARAGL